MRAFCFSFVSLLLLLLFMLLFRCCLSFLLLVFVDVVVSFFFFFSFFFKKIFSLSAYVVFVRGGVLFFSFLVLRFISDLIVFCSSCYSLFFVSFSFVPVFVCLLPFVAAVVCLFVCF